MGPQLVTAHDERQRCCVILKDGKRCPQRTRFWVGEPTSGYDDYTLVCIDHLEAVRRPGDVVDDVR